jgi:uncharacterized membrane protein (GlpM family)
VRRLHEVLIIALKGLAGGLLVVAFALLSEALAPKRFAGLFSAAPSVAIAGLVITLADKGFRDARAESRGMLAGAAGMVAYALVVVPLMGKRRAAPAATLALGAWFVAALGVGIPLLIR